MKNLKYVLMLILIAFFSKAIKADDVHTGEITITNKSTERTLYVKVFPASMVFNGFTDYNLNAKNKNLQAGHEYDYINGRNDSVLQFSLVENQELQINSDQDGTIQETFCSVGYGIYKFEIWNDFSFRDTFTVEWDGGYPYNFNHFSADLNIKYYDNNSNPRILFMWSGGTREYPISYVNKHIVAWDQQYAVYTSTDSIRRLRTKSFGNFIYGTNNSNNYVEFPQDSRADCGAQNQEFSDTLSGLLSLNLTIDKNTYTRDTLIDTVTNIVVTPHASLKINSGKTLSMITPSSPSGGYTNLIIQDTGNLSLMNGAKIIVNSPNRITLKKNSSLKLFPNSEIQIKPGAFFCNEGGEINGSGKIIFTKGLHQPLCNQLADFIIRDSAKFVLADSAEVEIPDSTTLHFTGKTTSLILNPNSKLKFGVGSKILFDSGAKLIANNAEFSSVDSTKKWLGISLNGISKDTIKNCLIKNANYGIAIMNKEHNSTGFYSTEISNCTFVNQTSSVLNNAVYVYNSNNVLLLDNSVSSNITSGFTFGIYAEYCPTGNLNIIENEISNANNALTIIQSSPYIAGNTLEGNSSGESGIFLDNSNGTIEYNIINDFFYSYYTYYSSPNLLKNIFNNSFEDNLMLVSYSTPVMHPITSESATNFYSGGNLITGNLSNSGINFSDESFPDMNHGSNYFSLSTADYYISGEVPEDLNGDLFTLNNYWGETPRKL